MINIYRVRIMKILNINMPPDYYLIIMEDRSEGKTECIEGLGCVGTESVCKRVCTEWGWGGNVSLWMGYV